MGSRATWTAGTLTCWLIAATLAAQSQPPAGPGEREGWEQLNLREMSIAGSGIRVFYEPALEPNLPIFEREYRKLLAQEDQREAIASKRAQIVADINHILGAVDANTARQERDLVGIAGTLSGVKPTLYLVKQQTVKDFLRSGGQLPDFEYDRATDSALYSPHVSWRPGEEPPENLELCIPIPPDKDFAEYISGFLGTPMRHFLGDWMAEAAIHEVTEMTLLRRARPTDPYWRWFSDGFANAITALLVEEHLGQEAAEEFAAAYNLEKYRQFETETNLAYWMLGNFFVYVSRTPVEQEGDILYARYAYSMFEAQRLIDAHGIECVREILDKIAARESRRGSDLLEVIKEVTGEDMAPRLAHYQTFATKEEGIPKYGTAYQAAQEKQDWAQMYVNVLRIMELRGDVFSLNYLQSFANAALFLFKMGHEAAGDEAMRQAIDLYSKSPFKYGREGALEMFLNYALRCNNPAKAEKEADELLASHPDTVSALTVKMVIAMRHRDLAQAQELARRIQRQGEEQSANYKLAARVLAFDPNTPNTSEQTP